MTARTMVEICNVTKRFGAVTVLDDVSLDVPEGSATAIIGPSGSGKTTLIRCINHLLPIDSGQIRIAGELLEVHGFQVECAADAEEAQRILVHRVPDLIVTDIALPGMDGLTFTRRLKADDRLKHVPVVALTAFAMRGDEERAAAAGCRTYIVKPIDIRRFAEQISEILRSNG